MVVLLSTTPDMSPCLMLRLLPGATVVLVVLRHPLFTMRCAAWSQNGEEQQQRQGRRRQGQQGQQEHHQPHQQYQQHQQHQHQRQHQHQEEREQQQSPPRSVPFYAPDARGCVEFWDAAVSALRTRLDGDAFGASVCTVDGTERKD